MICLCCTDDVGNPIFASRYQDFRNCHFEATCLSDKEVVIQYAIQNGTTSTRSGVLVTNKSYNKGALENRRRSHRKDIIPPTIVNMTCETGANVLQRNNIQHVDWSVSKNYLFVKST